MAIMAHSDEEDDPFAAFGSDDDAGDPNNEDDADPFGAFGSDDEEEQGDTDQRNMGKSSAAAAAMAKSLVEAANQKLASVAASKNVSADNHSSSSTSATTEEERHHQHQVDLSYLQPLQLSTWPAPLYQGPVLLVSALPVGGGRGYVASQNIDSGTLVLVEEPIMEWPDQQRGNKLNMVSVKHLLQHENAQSLILDFEDFHPTKEDVDTAFMLMARTSQMSDFLEDATVEQIVKMVKLVEDEYDPSTTERIDGDDDNDDDDDILANSTGDKREQNEDEKEDVVGSLVDLANLRGIQSRNGSSLTRLDIVRLLLALRYNGLESGVYRHVAMLNHHDYPNCAKFMPDQSQAYSEVRTTKPIAAGETLTISYLPRIMCHASRRRHLWEQHRFDIGTSRLKGKHYKMELVGKDLPPSPLFQGDSDDSVTRRVERATEELESMQKEISADLEESGGGGNGSFETAKALELSALELYTQAVEELLKNSEHILLLPILSLHVDACALVLQDRSLTNAVRMGVLARQTLSIHRLLPLQKALLGPDHFDLARTNLDFANAISELLSRSAKHLYELKIPSLNTFSSWASLESQSRKEHDRIKALYPRDASKLLQKDHADANRK